MHAERLQEKLLGRRNWPAVCWGPGDRNVGTWKEGGGPAVDLNGLGETLVWGVSANRSWGINGVGPQKSQYFAAEETIAPAEEREDLVFDRTKYSGGYETALSVLLKTGWSPKVTDDVNEELWGAIK